MHSKALATMLAAFVAAPLAAALFPDPQVSISISSTEQDYESWPVSLRFVYNNPEDDLAPEYTIGHYDVEAKVSHDHDSFQTGYPDQPVDYITLTGYGLCYVFDTNGNVTTLLSYGTPQTVVVEDSQPQVRGTCYSHHTSLIPLWYLEGQFCRPWLDDSAPASGIQPEPEPVSKQAPGTAYRRKEKN